MYEIRARLWRGGVVVGEEIGRLAENDYLLPELLLMLQVAGFRDVSVEGRHTGLPVTADDGTVCVVAIA